MGSILSFHAAPLRQAAAMDDLRLQLVRRKPVSRLGERDGTALDWLMSGAAASAGPAELLDGVIARLSVAGHPIERATLNMSTLHPQLLGITANWRGDLGICDEVQVNAHVRETSDYLTSPLKLIIEECRSIRMNPQDPAAGSTYPIIKLSHGRIHRYWDPLKRASLSTLSRWRRASRDFPRHARGREGLRRVALNGASVARQIASTC